MLRDTELPPSSPGSAPSPDLEDAILAGVHVDFKTTDPFPLKEGKLLGWGVNGGVHECELRGRTVAWKKRFCRRNVSEADRKEIGILKKLRHPHIIELVGTYTSGKILGLLLFPVAVCDLATYMDDVNHALQTTMGPLQDETTERFAALQLQWPQKMERMQEYLLRHRILSERLIQSIGCIAGALAYLHSQQIRHKDLKPSNILLSHDGLWVTDFGVSTDFSLLTSSATDNGERGTPKYFAPEVAAYKPSGRSADIFSLGFIFVEMLTLSRGVSLNHLQQLRPRHDRSFQANLSVRRQWMQHLKTGSIMFMHLRTEVRHMLDAEPKNRPTAQDVFDHIALIEGFRSKTSRAPSLCAPCCYRPSTNPDSQQLQSSRRPCLYEQPLKTTLDSAVQTHETEFRLPLGTIEASERDEPSISALRAVFWARNPHLPENEKVFLWAQRVQSLAHDLGPVMTHPSGSLGFPLSSSTVAADLPARGPRRRTSFSSKEEVPGGSFKARPSANANAREAATSGAARRSRFSTEASIANATTLETKSPSPGDPYGDEYLV